MSIIINSLLQNLFDKWIKVFVVKLIQECKLCEIESSLQNQGGKKASSVICVIGIFTTCHLNVLLMLNIN